MSFFSRHVHSRHRIYSLRHRDSALLIRPKHASKRPQRPDAADPSPASPLTMLQTVLALDHPRAPAHIPPPSLQRYISLPVEQGIYTTPLPIGSLALVAPIAPGVSFVEKLVPLDAVLGCLPGVCCLRSAVCDDAKHSPLGARRSFSAHAQSMPSSSQISVPLCEGVRRRQRRRLGLLPAPLALDALRARRRGR